MIHIDKISYSGWKDCIRLEEDGIELIVLAAVGPRIIRYGFHGGPNLFYEKEEQKDLTGGEAWRIYGGHRLWHAPEDHTRSYCPDNAPVASSWDGRTLSLLQPTEIKTGIQKIMEITLENGGAKILHRIVNHNLWTIRAAPWALSVMTPGGTAIAPQETLVTEGPETLSPVRSLALWSYTQMADPRWTWGNRHILLRQNAAGISAQKAGFLNRRGWAAYHVRGTFFIDRFPYDAGSIYPDRNTNNQLYTDREILEIETLAPLQEIAPGSCAEHTEVWNLFCAEWDGREESVTETLNPFFSSTD